MTDEDKDYIVWLSNRLVYKYNEDPKIIKNIETILDKNQIEISFYRKTHESINKNLSEAIDSLINIKQSYKNSINNTNDQYVASVRVKNNEVFENLDFDNIFN